jgi:hypothetical protein
MVSSVGEGGQCSGLVRERGEGKYLDCWLIRSRSRLGQHLAPLQFWKFRLRPQMRSVTGWVLKMGCGLESQCTTPNNKHLPSLVLSESEPLPSCP